jgi:hypothetical protein
MAPRKKAQKSFVSEAKSLLKQKIQQKILTDEKYKRHFLDYFVISRENPGMIAGASNRLINYLKSVTPNLEASDVISELINGVDFLIDDGLSHANLKKSSLLVGGNIAKQFLIKNVMRNLKNL